MGLINQNELQKDLEDVGAVPVYNGEAFTQSSATPVTPTYNPDELNSDLASVGAIKIQGPSAFQNFLERGRYGDHTQGVDVGRIIGQGIKAIPYANPAAAIPLMGTQLLSDIQKHGVKIESVQDLEDLKDRGLLTPEQFEDAKARIESANLNIPSLTEMPYHMAEADIGLPFTAKKEI
jgi:hypothetical protein